MSKRVKIIIVAVVAVLLLSIGFTTLVSAQESQGEEADTTQETQEEGVCTCKGPFQNYISKVADILEIEEEELINACNQARQQTADEVMDRCLERAMGNECINEQEANQIREWWQNRPKEALQDMGQCARVHLRAAKCHRLIHCCPCE